MIEGMVHCVACDTTVLPDATDGACPNCGRNPTSGEDIRRYGERGPTRLGPRILGPVIFAVAAACTYGAGQFVVFVTRQQSVDRGVGWIEYMETMDRMANVEVGFNIVTALLLLVMLVLLTRYAVVRVIRRSREK